VEGNAYLDEATSNASCGEAVTVLSRKAVKNETSLTHLHHVRHCPSSDMCIFDINEVSGTNFTIFIRVTDFLFKIFWRWLGPTVGHSECYASTLFAGLQKSTVYSWSAVHALQIYYTSDKENVHHNTGMNHNESGTNR
jgi:hypothetical protein